MAEADPKENNSKSGGQRWGGGGEVGESTTI